MPLGLPIFCSSICFLMAFSFWRGRAMWAFSGSRYSSISSTQGGGQIGSGVFFMFSVMRDAHWPFLRPGMSDKALSPRLRDLDAHCLRLNAAWPKETFSP